MHDCEARTESGGGMMKTKIVAKFLSISGERLCRNTPLHTRLLYLASRAVGLPGAALCENGGNPVTVSLCAKLAAP